MKTIVETFKIMNDKMNQMCKKVENTERDKVLRELNRSYSRLEKAIDELREKIEER